MLLGNDSTSMKNFEHLNSVILASYGLARKKNELFFKKMG